MPPIQMSAAERAALTRLSRGPAPVNEIRRDHVEKFVNHGLAVKQTFRLAITPKGQLEVLRQRFRSMSTRRIAHTSAHDFISLFEEKLKSGFFDRTSKRTSESES